ncbi:hypothetical protein T11_6562 [Trichinella zimbabwensis]|uniref:Uncharacterized protein n=1 Tax=Trichinella zimbabwensis TaxID=268475 RepID=A0A0V1H590_9BILA|nr:hypothetical protein T11_6562 [Trichinella zimbabwensis]
MLFFCPKDLHQLNSLPEELDKRIFSRRRDRSASKRLPPVYIICLYSKPPRQARTRRMRRLLPSVAASLLTSVV